MISFGRHVCNNFDVAIEKEWLITNSNGAYASSTAIFANTRKYHGLLVAEIPGVEGRVLLFPNIDEEVTIAGSMYHLATNVYHKTVYPKGYSYLESFHIDDDIITCIYLIDNIRLKKEIFLMKDTNTTVINYTLLTPQSFVKLHIKPFVAFRDVNTVMREMPYFDPNTKMTDGKKISVHPYRNMPPGYIYNPDGGEVTLNGIWYRDFFYAQEESMGFEAGEDLYNMGTITLGMEYNESKSIIFSTENFENIEYKTLRKKYDEQTAKVQNIYRALEHKIINKNHKAPVEELIFAANSFLKIETDHTCVAAGFPWACNCWLRDTLSSIPGLFLVTGKFSEAKEILQKIVMLEKDGLLPLRGDNPKVEKNYASADTTLLFFYALGKYLSYTGDFEMVKSGGEFFKKLTWIIHKYMNGTEYNIHMDKADNLIVSDYTEAPLTWMDAVSNGVAVTPRRGKVVEINALWYNAIKVMENIAAKNGEQETKDAYGQLAGKVFKSFNEIFWNEQKDCLFDFCDGIYFDEKIRPNQIMAISLPYALIEDSDKREKIMNTVVKELYTSFGLRTLTNMDVAFKNKYEGNQTQRDNAEHQGTVWGWTVGAFVTAYLKTHGRTEESLRFVETVYEPVFENLKNGGLGTVSEMFDGGFPYKEKGRLSHSWAVAEILRSYFEDYLAGDDKY